MRGMGFDIGMISKRPRSMVEGLLAEATFLNDLSTATFTNASSNRLDPYNRVYAGVNVRRRRPMLRMARRVFYGDLIEPARTNLILRSQTLANAAWTKTDCSITTGAANADDGTATLDLVTGGTLGTCRVLCGVTVTANRGAAVSGLLKRGNTDWIFVRLINTDNIRAYFNLATGAVGTVTQSGTGSGATAFLESRGDGVYRFGLAGIPSSTATAIQFDVAPVTADGGSTIPNNARLK